ncbi:MAG: ribonuclease PH [Acidiferrobacteraceae bacterium]|nr:ribonuclease PH [Acidiferrobacteraceae bacterium]|tara:strand:+ start:2856 stop:3569 length:714 start_codon:yes stop_codon:yes gene_type:complete
MRSHDRRNDEMRPISFTRNYNPHAEGSVLVAFGNTHVLCTASIENSVPSFLRGKNQGWVTAEYGMLPRATNTRTRREAKQNQQAGRTQEIQRLIGRSLRSVVELEAIGERTIILDCDVLQADGGTRTAAITGAWIALADALDHLVESGVIHKKPITDQVAAVAVGLIDDIVMLDLDYAEDSRADTDMNFVINSEGKFIEIQGTAEKSSFAIDQLQLMASVAQTGIRQLIALQLQTRS